VSHTRRHHLAAQHASSVTVILAEYCYPVLLAVSAALFLAAGGFLMSRD
jgi:hypothetical protein